ncbi:MAG TPA: hypothetical protein EYQ75_09340 [Planctomycetaceae bacterium]|nr:hypothetical protein [Planctomycetaceae bacterium]
MYSTSQFSRLSLVMMAVIVGFAPAPAPDALAETEKKEQVLDPRYREDVQPLLTKYCVGCHNPEDAEGKLSLEDYTQLIRGGEHGAALVAGRAEASRLIRVLTGQAEPRMPPEDNERPTDREIDVLVRWVNAGAKGPQGKALRPQLPLLTKIVPRHGRKRASTALALFENKERRLAAFGSYRTVQLVQLGTDKELGRLDNLAGKVTDLDFSKDGTLLAIASGISGLVGEVTVWDVQQMSVVLRLDAHRDSLYAVSLSPNQDWLATGGYDKQIRIWEVASGKLVRTLDGHNGAVYDLDFSPDGQLLLSASADETAKVWHVASGERLDTLGQPTAEVYAASFSPDGKTLAAAGADNRIRIWKLVSLTEPRINPILYARFAHEGAITRLAFSADGRFLASAAEDRTLKVWNTKTMREVQLWEDQSDIVAGLAILADQLLVGRLDGSSDLLRFADAAASDVAPDHGSGRDLVQTTDQPMSAMEEAEPNNSITNAEILALPAKVMGAINDQLDGPDEDWYQFNAKTGEQWVLEVNAARSKSQLDSLVEIRDAKGMRVPRVRLQAVRDSYFRFRGKDSTTSGDFRVQNWQEMELNEYLYCQGEVVKLWLYPRGPDSGFLVYPGFGSRRTFFDTTPATHALHEPCYVVRPFAPGTMLIANGLPVFDVFYENDDDSHRKYGTDSRLTFTAPSDGTYFVRVSDVRGFESEQHTYTLTVRPRRPDFKVTLHGANPSVNAGSGKEFELRVERLDDFQGAISVQIENVPEGYYVTSPVVIEANQARAYGVLHALGDAEAVPAEKWKEVTITASAEIWGEEQIHDVNTLGEVKLAEAAKVTARIVPADGEPIESEIDQPWSIQIRPGETVFAKVVVERGEFKGRISLGKEFSGRNLPHGVYVDNIGLNGLLIVEGKSGRQFQITAAKWVSPGTRLFHLVANVEGNQATWPVLLHVVAE